MTEVSFTFEEAPDFDAARERVMRELRKEMSMLATVVKEYAQTAVPVDEGTLKNSITASDVRQTKTRTEVTVGTSLVYAPYVEFGTGSLGDPSVPHTARTSWVYYSERLGRFVTTRGQRPRPFMRPSIEENRELIEERLAAAVRRGTG